MGTDTHLTVLLVHRNIEQKFATEGGRVVMVNVYPFDCPDVDTAVAEEVAFVQNDS